MPEPSMAFGLQTIGSENSPIRSEFVSGLLLALTQCLAMACGWVVLDELQITVLGVEPEQRRRGLGRTVLKQLLLDASSAGARHAILDVAEDNHGARTLYSAFGFQTVGRRDRYYRDGKDALIQSLEMQREIKLNSINSALSW